MKQNKQNQELSFTFTDHLLKNKKKELELMQKFRFQFPKPLTTKQKIGNDPSGRLAERHRTFIPNDTCSDIAMISHNSRIDNQASVINDRLVYLQDEDSGKVKNNRQLLKQLKQNNIGYKQYILGKKDTYKKQMEEHHKMRQEEIIKQYIKKHINMEKTTKIEFSEDFESTKTQLFSSK